MGEEVDWSRRRESIRKYDFSQGPIEEVLSDPNRIEISRDPGQSPSARGFRVVGYSPTAGMVLTVVAVEANGTVYGLDVDKANAEEIRRYQKENRQ